MRKLLCGQCEIAYDFFMQAKMQRLGKKIPVRLRQNQYVEFLLLGAMSGLLIVLSFPPYSIYPLIFAALIPLLLAITRAKKLTQALVAAQSCAFFMIVFGFYWVSFVATNFGGLPWIAGQVVLLLFSLIGEMQFLFWAIILFYYLKRFSWDAKLTFWLPVFYSAVDFIYPKIFPSTLGHCLYPWLALSQIVEYSGVYGLTFLVVAVNGIGLQLLKDHRQRWAQASLAAMVVLLLGLHGLGQLRINYFNKRAAGFDKTINVAVIQANVGDLEKLASEQGIESSIQSVLAKYESLSFLAQEKYHPDLIIWPETAYPFLYSHFADWAANQSGTARDQWMKNFFEKLKTPLFFGSYFFESKKDFNSAFLLAPPFELVGMYRKSILLAFGEYVPLGPFSDYVLRYIPSIANFGRGPGPQLLTLPGKQIKFAPQICYEGIFPEHSRAGSKLGADLLLNITNDSWFGPGTEPPLHLLLTIFRTIELRKPMLRATNTGISAYIDWTGKIIAQTPIFKETIFQQSIKLPSQPKVWVHSFYERFGELISWLMVLSAIGFWGTVVGPWLPVRRKN